MNFLEFKKIYQKKEVLEMENTAPHFPILSVCVQTYMHAKYIRQCLDSILMQQTTFPFEIIVGEDASTDGTREICIEYASKFPDRIRLFLHHRENNIMIERLPTGRFNFMYNYFSSRGKYIAMCEGDDYWIDPLKLQKQVDFLERNSEYSASFHNTLVIEGNINNYCTPKSWRIFNRVKFTTNDTISETSLFHTSSFVFKSRFKDLPKWFVLVLSGDMALFSLNSLYGPMYRIDEDLSVYRKHSLGITNKITIINFHRNRIKLWKNFKKSCSAENYDKLNEVLNFHKKEIFKLEYKSLKLSIRKFLSLKKYG